VARKKISNDVQFGERLKQLRESRSLNVTELAKRLNVSHAAIWHWENRGTKPRSSTVGAIAAALGVPRGFLEIGAQSNVEGSSVAAPAALSVPQRAGALTLEELIRAIEAKGFDVYVRSRDLGPGTK
jgi:transcriptional regulator with XRE-family HTH domain